MELTIENLRKRLIKYYFVAAANVDIILDEELDFIEECFANPHMEIDDIAKALIDIYMVA